MYALRSEHHRKSTAKTTLKRPFHSAPSQPHTTSRLPYVGLRAQGLASARKPPSVWTIWRQLLYTAKTYAFIVVEALWGRWWNRFERLPQSLSSNVHIR